MARMHPHLLAIIAVSLLSGHAVAQDGRSRATSARDAQAAELLRGSKLKYLGCFDIPPGGTWQEPASTRYDYSPGTIAYRQDKDALYVATHEQSSTNVGLVKVPESLSAKEIPTAVELEKPIELQSIPEKQVRLRGLYWDETTKTLYYNFTVWYNVEGKDAAGFGAMRDGEFHGLWYVAHNNACAGYITRDTTSGRLIMGNAVAQGIATSSLGPSAFRLAFDDRKLPPPGVRLPFEPLLFHPHGQPEADPSKYARLSTGKPWWHGMTLGGGECVGNTMVFAVDEGSRYFYGEPADFQQQFGFAPRGGGKGYHNDPYTPMLWLYSMADLNGVAHRRNGWWQPRPYEYWKIEEFPAQAALGGMTYDARQRRLFISQQYGNEARTPRVYVYAIGS